MNEMIDLDDQESPATFTKLKPEEWDVSVRGCINGGGTKKEFYTNLKLEGNEDWNKWVDPLPVETWIIAKMKKPTFIKMIGLKSANDYPERDPLTIEILVEYEDSGIFNSIEEFDNLEFSERHQLLDFPIYTNGKITALKVLIKLNKAKFYGGFPGDVTQLNELVLYR